MMFLFALRDITCLHTSSSIGNEQIQTQHVLVTWRYSPTVCGVHIFYKYSQRPLLMGWKLKENTATPNHEHSNQRQQLIHVLKICPFQGHFLSFQSSVCKASSTSNPKVSKMEAAPLGAIQWNTIIWRTRTSVHILILEQRSMFL